MPRTQKHKTASFALAARLPYAYRGIIQMMRRKFNAHLYIKIIIPLTRIAMLKLGRLLHSFMFLIFSSLSTFLLHFLPSQTLAFPTHQLTMRLHLVFFAICLSLSISFTPISARLFPNVSAIPPWIAKNASPGAWDAFRNLTGCRPGVTSDGLAKLKNYFHRFGYIPDSPSNFTDDFDDALESAIKTYQKNFNLNVTGELDLNTLQQIIRPRCGVADIVNGTSTMNSGKENTSAASNNTRFHTVSHYTFFPGTPRWPDGTQTLTYAFLPGNSLSDEVKNVFATAFDRWSEVTTLSFTEASSYESADLRIAFYSGDHGDGEPFDGVLGTLAHSFSPTNGRFHLDAAENWVVSGDVTQSSLSTAVDLESVAVHEIGHLLGLGHSSVEEAIMYPTISARTRKVNLADDDIQGIQQLYGSNPNYNGTATTTSSQQNDSSHGGRRLSAVGSAWGFLVLLAVGFAHLIL